MHVGIAQVDWTPPAGLPLMGHVRSDYAAAGVHDPLYAKAVVFADDAGGKLAVLSVDVCMLGRGHVASMRRYIAERCEIAPQNILIAATHIHSGPATMSLYQMPAVDDEQMARYLQRACEAVIEAANANNKNLQPARLRVGAGRVENLSFCRRLRCSDGVLRMNWEDLAVLAECVTEPAGPIDPEVAVLIVEQGGCARAVIVNFALHPAFLDYENQLYSGGYPGYLAEAMTQRMGGEFTTLFLTGCCGDLNHLNCAAPDAPRRGHDAARRGHDAARRTGYALADAVAAAMNAAEPMEADTIAVSHESVPLTRLRLTDEQVRWARGVLEAPPSKAQADTDGLPAGAKAATWLAMHELAGSDDRVEVMAARIGEIGLVGLPGEVFCQLGLSIKSASPARRTFIAELANDAIGYLPTAGAFDEGGYETTPGATHYDRTAGQTLAASAQRQLSRLFRG